MGSLSSSHSSIKGIKVPNYAGIYTFSFRSYILLLATAQSYDDKGKKG